VAAKTWDKRRAVGDFLMSLCALAIVLGTLVAFDARVRDQVMLRVNGAQASTDIAVAQSQARHLAALIVSVAREQADQHAPLMIFVVVATGLTLFMLRT
jgi:hypothetical protein